MWPIPIAGRRGGYYAYFNLPFLLANASLLLLPMSAPWALSKLTE